MKKQLFLLILMMVSAVCLVAAPAFAETVLADNQSVKTVRKRQDPKGDSKVFTVRYEAVYSTRFTGKDGTVHALTVRSAAQKIGEQVRDRAWGDMIMRTVDRDLVVSVSLDGRLLFSGESDQDSALHVDLALPTGDILDVRVDASRASSRMIFHVKTISSIPDLLENAF